MTTKRHAGSLLLGVLLAACAGMPATPAPAGSPAPTPGAAPVSTPGPTVAPSGTAAAATPTAAPTSTPSPSPSPGTPAPTAAPSPAPAAASCVSLGVHTVVGGDTLWEIAQQYGVTVKSLLAANPQITDRSLIRPGDRITIPPRVIDLGMLGGYPTMAHDINDLGQVVGQVLTASSWHAFLWQDGVMDRPRHARRAVQLCQRHQQPGPGRRHELREQPGSRLPVARRLHDRPRDPRRDHRHGPN